MPSGGERIGAEQESSEVSPRKFTVITWKTNTERGPGCLDNSRSSLHPEQCSRVTQPQPSGSVISTLEFACHWQCGVMSEIMPKLGVFCVDIREQAAW